MALSQKPFLLLGTRFPVLTNTTSFTPLLIWCSFLPSSSPSRLIFPNTVYIFTFFVGSGEIQLPARARPEGVFTVTAISWAWHYGLTKEKKLSHVTLPTTKTAYPPPGSYPSPPKEPKPFRIPQQKYRTFQTVQSRPRVSVSKAPLPTPRRPCLSALAPSGQRLGYCVPSPTTRNLHYSPPLELSEVWALATYHFYQFLISLDAKGQNEIGLSLV